MKMKKVLTLVSLCLLGLSSYGQGEDCPNAIPLAANGCSGPASYDNTGITGTLTGGGSCFTGGSNNGMWFTFVAATPTVVIDVLGTGITDPEVVLMENASGCGGTFTELACESPGGDPTLTFSALIPGTTYYLSLIHI